MNPRKITALAAGACLAALATLGAAMPAMAATGAVTVSTLNLRAGPGTGYPVVRVLPAGAQVTLYGCTGDTRWCDAAWDGGRGWVSASYVEVTYHGAPRPLTPGTLAIVGLGVVAFNQAYWNAHYVGQPWYGRWSYYHGGAGAGHAGGTVCGPNGCAHRGVTVGPGGAAHAGSTRCGPNRCAHVGAVRGPGGNTVVRRGVYDR
ncbi:SH3 domain-containing protein [Acidimangrovimonas sediminis]|uniref:SH3 domain-containing protein n=1 Tax=Acidimangrovimonas sediminis TaxID=2056283 RepID=UPI000C807E21|nr:SH3 domain-containing protein [Acidimangrovimonas sediminis]